jgi:hypothetical protein
MHTAHERRAHSPLARSLLAAAATALLAGCTTRSVVLTNTSDQPARLSSTGTSDGWNYERMLEPGESFELRVAPNQPISLPGITVQVR